jgi:hypothetical protein
MALSDKPLRPLPRRWPAATSRSDARRTSRGNSTRNTSTYSSVGTFGKALLGTIVAMATAITSISAALYIVAPQYAPREKLGAELDRISIAQGVPYEFFNRGAGVGGGSPPIEDPTQDGLEVLMHARLSGFENRTYSVRIDIYDAETNARIGPVAKSETLASECDSSSPGAREDSVAFRCWLVAPPKGIQYFIRAELHDLGQTAFLDFAGPDAPTTLLDFIDSKSFESLGVNVYGD